jgi:hypothetical protein
MNVHVIRTNGDEEDHDVDRQTQFADIERLIGATTLDNVNLRDGRLMWVDDNGYDTELIQHGPQPGYGFVFERRCTRARKPVNAKATALYHAVCVPGVTHQIVGDVAIVAVDDDDE